MAGVIKSKGAQVFSNKLSPLNTDSGSELIGNALSRATSRIADTMYSEAVVEQQELGRTTALNTPVRGSDGKLTFVDVTETMSQVARDSARPIIERNYGIAIKTDMSKALQKARLESGDDQELFQKKSTVALKGIMDAIPDEFKAISKSLLEESGAQSQAEHYYDMSFKAAAKQKSIALENLQFHTITKIQELAAITQGGDLKIAQSMFEKLSDEINGLKMPDGEVVHEGFIAEGMTDQNVKSLNDELQKAYYGTLLGKDHTALLDSGKVKLAEALMLAVHTGEIPKEFAGKLRDIGITKDSLLQIKDVDLRHAIAGDMRITQSGYASDRSAEIKALKLQAWTANMMSGEGVESTKASQDNMQLFMDAGGITANMWDDPNTMAMIRSNPSLIRAMMVSNVMPTGLITKLNGAANGTIKMSPEQGGALLQAWATSSLGNDASGDFITNKGLSNEAQAFWANVNRHTKAYGLNRLDEALNTYRSPETMTDRMAGISFQLNDPNPERALNKRWLENDMWEGYPSSAKRKMRNVALLYYSQMSPDNADTALELALEVTFTKSKYIKEPYSGVTIKRSEYAPEALYNGATLKTFEDTAHAVLSTAGKSGLTLGEDVFLYPTSDSTNANVTWSYVDDNGDYILKDGMPLTISSGKINQFPEMKSKMLSNVKQRIEIALKLRDIAMTKTPEGKKKKTTERLTRLGEIAKEKENNQ